MNDWKDLGNQSQSMNNVLGNVTFGDGKNEFTFAPQQIIQISADKIKLDKLNPISPYRGLKPFENNEFDSNLFFGRDQLIGRLMENLTDRNLLLLLGASGSGKSSVIKAGLIPQLRKNLGTKFCELIFKPSQNPFFRLFVTLSGKFGDEVKESIVMSGQPETLIEIVSTLKKPEDYWLIYIDQFEELFTSSEPDKRDSFIQGLGLLYRFLSESKSQSVKIVMTMRADFLDRFDPFPVLGEITRGNIELITTMYEDELRQAIEQPAAKHGVVFQDGLVKRVIEDIKGQSGSLPLLQYTLDLLWEKDNIADPNDLTKPHPHTDRELNIDTYNTLGGVRGALQSHIEEVYTQKLKTSAQQEAAKQIFLKLIQWILGEGGQYIPVSWRRLRSDFEIGIEVETLDIFINERLIVSNIDNLSQKALQDGLDNKQQATVEIAHEILISVWERLTEWIGEAKDVLIAKSQLQADMNRYEEVFKENKIKANDELLIGSRLERILELWDDRMFELRSISLESEEIKFIEKSIEWRDRQIRKEKEQNQKLKNELTKSQLTEELVNLNQSLLLKPQLNKLIKVIKLAAECLQLNNSQPNYSITTILNQVNLVLLEALEKCREQNILEGHNKYVSTAIFSPDGTKILSGSADATMRLWDAESGQLVYTFKGHNDRVSAIAFSPDGTKILSGSADTTIRLWDVQSGKLLYLFEGHLKYVFPLVFSPDGTKILSGSADTTMRLWDVESGKLLRLFEGHSNSLNQMLFVENSTKILSGSEDRTVRLWDIESSKCIFVFYGMEQFSQDGKMIITGSKGGVLGLNLEKSDISSLSQEQIRDQYVQFYETDASRGVCFSPDGKIILTLKTDYTIELRPSSGVGNFFHSLKDYTHANYNIEHGVYHYVTEFAIFSPDSNQVLNYIKDNMVNHSKDNILNSWSTVSGKLLYTIKESDEIMGLDFSNDGKHLLSCSGNNIKLWSTKSVESLHTFDCGYGGKVKSIVFSPDGKSILCREKLGAYLWNIDSAQFISEVELRTFEGEVNFTPDSKQIIECGDICVNFFDVTSGQYLRTYELNPSYPYFRDDLSVFSGDNKKVFGIKFGIKTSVTEEVNIYFWDTNSGECLQTYTWEFCSQIRKGIWKREAIKFSPDGKYIAVYDNGRINLLDTASGQFLRTFKYFSSYAFSPDSSKIISIRDKKHSRDRTLDPAIELWDIDSGQCLQTYEGGTAYNEFFKFSPDGTQVLLSFRDSLDNSTSSIKLWDTISGELLRTYNGHTKSIIDVAFSPDGKYLASYSADNTLRLWQALNGEGLLEVAAERLRYHPILSDVKAKDGEQVRTAFQRYVWNPKSDEFNRQGLEKFRAKEYRGAIQFFSKAIDYNLEHIEAYYHRGLSYCSLQEFQNGSTDFYQAINLMKSQLQNLNTSLYSAIKFQSKKRRRYTFDPFFHLAEYYLTAICFLQSKPNLADVYFYQGWSRFKLRDTQQAKVDWQTADKIYKMQMSKSTNAKKISELLAHPSIVNLDKT